MNKHTVKECLLAHLKTKGYPAMTASEILQECKPMWCALEEAGPTGGKRYADFFAAAQRVALRHMDPMEQLEWVIRETGGI